MTNLMENFIFIASNDQFSSHKSLLVKDGIINDNLEIENEKVGKTLLTEELEIYQKAKLDELILEPIAVLTLEDCDERY